MLSANFRRVLLASAVSALSLAGSQAFAADPTTQALQAEVDALKDEINALKAQVQASQIQTIGDDQAQTRAAQNATGQFNGQLRAAAVDPGIALPRVTQNSQHRLAFSSGDGQYSIGLTGDIQIDAGSYNLKPASALSGTQQLSNGANARRARIGVTGTAPGGWGFALVYDAGNSQDTAAKGIETAQIVYGGIRGVAVEAGYSNTYFTLDQSTSSNDTLFLERSTASNIATNFNTGDARTNVGVRFFGDRYWAGGYLTGPASGDSHTLTAERLGAFERAAFQVLKGPDYSVHLGAGIDELLQAPNSGNVTATTAATANTLSLSDQPELRIDPTTFLNTGTIGTVANPLTGGRVINLETAATWRNFFWQGEYYDYNVSRAGLHAAGFNGAYGQVSWIVTGENHVYNPQSASYFRVMPANVFSPKDGTWGAWELAARWDYANLNSNFISGQTLAANPAAVEGGLQRSVTVGLNWYPNDLIRFLIDYNHVDYDKANAASVKGLTLGAPIGAKFDAVSVRAQVAY